MSDNIRLTFFDFEKEPVIQERSTDSDFTKDMNKDIAKFPFMNTEDLPFEINFIFENRIEINLKDTIPAGFVYNMADIPFLLQVVSYDKHSPYVRNAALIHDYMLKYKKELYDMWNLKAYGMDHRDFRILTSDVFERVLLHSGVPDRKAKRMRNAVDLFQKFFVWSWMGID